jgi:predicted negative regulator of RcsB-dependent stress response
MKKLDIRWAILIVFVLLLSGWWYWYEYRPNQIKEACAKYVARVSAAVAEDPSIKVSGDAHLKIIRQMQEGCIDAGGAAEFEKALEEGQSVAEAN